MASGASRDHRIFSGRRKILDPATQRRSQRFARRLRALGKNLLDRWPRRNTAPHHRCRRALAEAPPALAGRSALGLSGGRSPSHRLLIKSQISDHRWRSHLEETATGMIHRLSKGTCKKFARPRSNTVGKIEKRSMK